MKKNLILVALFSIVSLCLGCEEADLIIDPSFQFWGENGLTDWDIPAGSVERVSTWHEKDYAAALVGAPVIVTQRVPLFLSDFACLKLEVIADVEAETDTIFVVQWLDSAFEDSPQVIDSWSEMIATDSMETRNWTIPMPSDALSVRFTIMKQHEGATTFAQLRATGSDSCF